MEYGSSLPRDGLPSGSIEMFVPDRKDVLLDDTRIHIPPPSTSPDTMQAFWGNTPAGSGVRAPGMMVVDSFEEEDPSSLTTPERRQSEICASDIRKTVVSRSLEARTSPNDADAPPMRRGGFVTPQIRRSPDPRRRF